MRADEPARGFATDDRAIRFADLVWTPDVPGIRAREARLEGRRWAIVEYAPAARREEWCVDGHAGFVLQGAIEYEFADGGETVKAEEGDAFVLSTGRSHRGTNRADGPTRLFLLDEPASLAGDT